MVAHSETSRGSTKRSRDGCCAAGCYHQDDQEEQHCCEQHGGSSESACASSGGGMRSDNGADGAAAAAAAAGTFISQWLKVPSPGQVSASHTSSSWRSSSGGGGAASFPRRQRRRGRRPVNESPLPNAIHMLEDEAAQRNHIVHFFKHLESQAPGSLFLPRFHPSDILSVVGCKRGAGIGVCACVCVAREH
jgi:hypothetical protein